MSLPSQPNIPWTHPSRLLLAGGVAAMSVYVLLRTIYVSITHDEAYTFCNYIIKPIDETLNVTYTNNHLLNSLLARLCNAVFGSSETSIRLPNTIGAILFFVYGARLLTKLPAGKWFPVVAFVALTFNTFMLDFFGLCRGYGLSLGLLMISFFYQYVSFTSERRTRNEWAAVVFAALAATANYTLLNLFLIVACINLVRILVKARNLKTEPVEFFNALGSALVLLIGIVIFLKHFVGMMLKLSELGNFNFGGDNNMWIDSVGSLVSYTLYQLPVERYWIEQVLAYAGAAILISGIVASLSTWKKREWNPLTQFMLYLVLVITACGLAIWLQFHLLHVPYPKDRTVLYFVPMFALLALCLVLSGGKQKFVYAFFASLFFLPAVATQCINFNLRSVQFWAEDAGMREVTEKIIEEVDALGDLGRPAIVCTTFEVSWPLSYYLYCADARHIQNMYFRDPSWISVADLAVESDGSDEGKVYGPYEQRTALSGKTIFVRTPVPVAQTGTLIGMLDFENNTVEERKTVTGFQSTSADLLSDQQMFSKGINDTIDKWYQHGTLFLFAFDLKCIDHPVKVLAVLSITRGGEAIVWKPIDLALFTTQQNEWVHGEVVIHPDVPLQEGDAVMCYLLNSKKEAVALDNFSVTRLPPKP